MAKSTVPLDDLQILNDELAAPRRAGIALPGGLAAAAREMPARSGQLADRLAARLERGEALADAIQQETGGESGVYGALVAAGLRAGRLPAVLQSLAQSIRDLVEVRQAMVAALIYPIIVLCVAYALFVGFVLFVGPSFSGTFTSFRLPTAWAVRALDWLRPRVAIWGPAIPFAALVAIWIQAGRSTHWLEPAWWGVVGWLPGARRMLESARHAAFTNLLANLIGQDVPLAESLILASNATGDSRMRESALQLAERIQSGRAGSISPDEIGTLPPALAWSISTDRQGGMLARSLESAAERYRRRAVMYAEQLRLVLPVAMLLAIAASVTVLYALTLFVPLMSLWHNLAWDG